MKKFLFLITLIPSIVFAQSVGADRIFFNNAFGGGRVSPSPLENGNYVVKVYLQSWNSTSEEYVKCYYDVYYQISDGNVSVYEIKQNDCDDGFDVTPYSEYVNGGVNIVFDWTYNSPENKEHMVFTGSEVVRNSYHSYYGPVDSENTGIFKRPAILRITIYGASVLQAGGKIISNSGLKLSDK